MKRLVASIILFAFAVVFACSSIGWEKRILLKAEENFMSCMEDGEIDFQKTKQAIKEWNNDKKVLYLFVEKDDFSELENKIIAFETSLDFKMCKEIVMILNELRENSEVSFETLL